MSSRKGLSNIEKLVLGRLEFDSRAPMTRIATSIRRSQQQVSYTVNSMQKKGIIKSFFTLIDYSKFNVLNFRVYFRVNYISRTKFDELIEYLVKEHHTSWIATCSGSYDLICSFFAGNPSQFNKTLREIMARFPQQLQNYSVLTTVVVREFGRKYLPHGKIALPEVLMGGDSVPAEVDEKDMEMLDLVADDARKSAVSISAELSLSVKTVIERMKRLKEKGVIRGSRPLWDTRKAGYTPSLLMIRYHNITSDLESKFIGYLRVHPNVRCITKTLGEWDMEISIESKDVMERRTIEMDIRHLFAPLIQQAESVPLYHTYKKTFFPKFLLEGITRKAEGPAEKPREAAQRPA